MPRRVVVNAHPRSGTHGVRGYVRIVQGKVFTRHEASVEIYSEIGREMPWLFKRNEQDHYVFIDELKREHDTRFRQLYRKVY